MREYKVKGAEVYRDDDDVPRPAPAPAKRAPAPRDNRQEPVVVLTAGSAATGSRVGKPRPLVDPAKPRKRGERTFLVRYDSHFVGVFEAEEELTPRQAFVLVARDLAAADPAFAPEKLEIFKPVLLKAARPAKGLGALRGKLSIVGASLQALTRNP